MQKNILLRLWKSVVKKSNRIDCWMIIIYALAISLHKMEMAFLCNLRIEKRTYVRYNLTIATPT